MGAPTAVDEATGAGGLPAWELPLVLLGALRSHLDDTHRRLAERGHPDTRPVHGFALQAVGRGSSATEVASRLGVSKQAAAKTLDLLERQGYVEREPDSADARRKLVRPTARGEDFLRQSVAVFEEVQAEWAERIGPRRLRALHEDLRVLGADSARRLDLQSWLG
jgi:DNA-binding MarR family transcriptional regulator